MMRRADRGGYAVIEYVLLTVVVALATIAFFDASLADENSTMRLSLRSGFLALCHDVVQAGQPFMMPSDVCH